MFKEEEILVLYARYNKNSSDLHCLEYIKVSELLFWATIINCIFLYFRMKISFRTQKPAARVGSATLKPGQKYILMLMKTRTFPAIRIKYY